MLKLASDATVIATAYAVAELHEMVQRRKQRAKYHTEQAFVIAFC